jgi:WD40 repeat protein
VPEPVTYAVGGTVQAAGGIYVSRAADAELLELCRKGEFAYVLTSRQMGKSSLIVRTAEALADEGTRIVMIDLTELGAETTSDQWYSGILSSIAEQLGLAGSAVQWWQDHAGLSPARRFNTFLREQVLARTGSRIVIFVDEIDTTLRLGFTDDFFTSIRFLYNARATDPELARLSFVLVGVATPDDLIKDPERTPFNIGRRVDLTDFTGEEAKPLLRGLDLPEAEASAVLERVFHWTGGHPFLTLRLLQAARERAQTPVPAAVDDLVTRLFFGEASRHDSNLNFVADMLTRKAEDRFKSDVVVTRYGKIRSGATVPDEEADPVDAWMKLSGVVIARAGSLRVRNRIYELVFTEKWARQYQRQNWSRRLTVIAGCLFLVVIFVSIPLAIYSTKKWIEGSNINRKLAARGLAAQALLQSAPGRIAVSTLLGIQSLRILPSPEAAQALRDNLPFLRKLTGRVELKDAKEAGLPSPGARYAVLLDQENTAWVADLATQQRILRLGSEKELAGAVWCSGERLLLVTAVQDVASLRVLDVARKQWEEGFPAVEGRLRSAACRGDVAALGTGSGVGLIRLSRKAYFARLPLKADLLALSPDGAYLFAGASERTGLYHLPDLRRIAAYPAAGSTSYAEFSDNGQSLLFSSPTQSNVVLVRNPEAVTTLATGGGTGGVFSPDGRWFAISSFDAVRVFENWTGRELARIPADNLNDAAFTADGKSLLTFSSDGLIETWQTAPQTENSLISHAMRSASAVAFRGNTVESARFGEVGLWSKGRETTVRISSGELAAYGFASGGRYLVGASSHDVWVWELPQGARIATLTESSPVSAVAVDDAGSRVIALLDDGAAHLYSVAGGRRLRELKVDGATAPIAIRPDGQMAAIALKNGTLGLWDLRSGTFTTQTGLAPPHALAFSPGGEFIVYSGKDGTVRIWSVQEKRELARLNTPGPAPAVALSADRRLLAIGDSTGIRLTLWRDGDMIDFACGLLPRNLTPSEWTQYLPEEKYRKTCPNLP